VPDGPDVLDRRSGFCDFNDENPADLPIQIVIDFTDEVAEMEAAARHDRDGDEAA
jgi:hypothetical protein